MKKLILTPILALLFTGSSILTANNWPEEYLGLPGDNLNLYAVMDLFRESPTLESFERSLNDPDKIINNLDLNNDNYVDYIIVRDYLDRNVHNIVMSVAMTATEYQDVAVFTVQKFRDGSVQIQLIGDEALYGKNYIIEPVYDETPNPGYRGNTIKTKEVRVITTTYYHVAAWPVVTYIYHPTYVVWHSPWYWGGYPGYWVSWRPYYWHYYYGYHYGWHTHYYTYYRPWPHNRYSGYNGFYRRTLRNTSPQVVTGIRDGRYKTTYSKPDELSRGKNQYEKVSAAQNATNRNATKSNNSAVSNRANTEKTTNKINASASNNRNNTRNQALESAGKSNARNTDKSKASAHTVRSTSASGSSWETTSPSTSRNAATPSTSKSNNVTNRSSSTTKSATASSSLKATTKTTRQTAVSNKSNTGNRNTTVGQNRNTRSNTTGKSSSTRR